MHLDSPADPGRLDFAPFRELPGIRGLNDIPTFRVSPGLVGEFLHTREGTIRATRIYVTTKCDRGNQHALLTIVEKIHGRSCTTNSGKNMTTYSQFPYRKSPSSQCLNQSTHLRHQIPSPAGTAGQSRINARRQHSLGLLMTLQSSQCPS